jgi:hypothetical protein
LNVINKIVGVLTEFAVDGVVAESYAITFAFIVLTLSTDGTVHENVLELLD